MSHPLQNLSTASLARFFRVFTDAVRTPSAMCITEMCFAALNAFYSLVGYSTACCMWWQELFWLSFDRFSVLSCTHTPVLSTQVRNTTQLLAWLTAARCSYYCITRRKRPWEVCSSAARTVIAAAWHCGRLAQSYTAASSTHNNLCRGAKCRWGLLIGAANGCAARQGSSCCQRPWLSVVRFGGAVAS